MSIIYILRIFVLILFRYRMTGFEIIDAQLIYVIFANIKNRIFR